MVSLPLWLTVIQTEDKQLMMFCWCCCNEMRITAQRVKNACDRGNDHSGLFVHSGH